MKQHTALIFLAVTLTVGCGDSASNDDDNASTNGENSAANGTPNGTANRSANSTVNGPDGIGPGWLAEVEGAPIDLPVVGSNTMTTTVNGGVLSLAGASSNTSAVLAGAIELDGEIGIKEYGASLLQLGYGEPSYACSQIEGLVVAITALDPIEGTFTGPMSCQNNSDTGDTFVINVTDGWFRGGTLEGSR